MLCISPLSYHLVCYKCKISAQLHTLVCIESLVKVNNSKITFGTKVLFHNKMGLYRNFIIVSNYGQNCLKFSKLSCYIHIFKHGVSHRLEAANKFSGEHIGKLNLSCKYGL